MESPDRRKTQKLITYYFLTRMRLSHILVSPIKYNLGNNSKKINGFLPCLGYIIKLIGGIFYLVVL